ncbi:MULTISPECIES: serine/threonine-protein kinase [unclassified Kribbella]|uniref:serine/threonine-protein kinase n=1 Tax=unclassified Kribbella TaxID=2644121 RepID=UPI00301A5A18
MPIDPDAQYPWLATEYLPGPTLQKAIDTFGPLAPGGVRSLAGGLAEALDAIHRSGLIHRDLKPSNIVLTDNGPRVIDFGIARALEEANLTATGVVIGTPGYLSPEQVTGTAIGPPSDMFALGAVLVFAASGRGPFATGNPASLLHRIVHEQPYIPPLPDPLQDLVRRCLARDPAHRPTPAEMLQIVGSPANTAVIPPPAATIIAPTKLLPEPPTPAQQEPPVQHPTPMQHDMPVPHPGTLQPRPPQQTGATFTTTRTRPAIIAVITTLLAAICLPRQTFAADPSGVVIGSIATAISLYFAIRYWRLVLRRRVVLHLSPEGLAITRAYEQAAIPWSSVTRIRIAGDVRRPWLVAWLNHEATLPTPIRSHHGGRKLYPIAHGRSGKRRNQQLHELRAALNWYAGHLHDTNY